MKRFKHGWRFAFGAAIAALVSAAVLSCETPGQDDDIESSISEIVITTPPTRTVYGLGETLDLTGLVVTATFEDETVGPYAVTAANLSQTAAIDTASASVPITITVNGHAEVFNIAVFPVVSKSIGGTYTGYGNLNAAFKNPADEDTIILYDDQTIKNGTNPEGKTVTLQGYGAERTITHEPGGKMFDLSEDGTVLILGDKITLDGEGEGNGSNSLVSVSSNAALIMEDGSAITGGKTSDGMGIGGGVCVVGGTFTMKGGTISGNGVIGCGGGVYVDNGGEFTMNDGIISGNMATLGGGVFVGVGTFTYNAGTFTGNTAAVYGHMVYKTPLGVISAKDLFYAGAVENDQSAFIAYDEFPPPQE
jgi:hypothetical protein